MAYISGGDIKEWPSKSFVSHIYTSCKEYRNTIFLEDVRLNKTYTFDDLLQSCNRVAATMKSMGIGTGHLVSYFGINSFDSFSFVYGVILSGATISPINPDLKPVEVSKMLWVSKPSLIFAEESYLGLVEASLAMIDLNPRVVTDITFKSLLVSEEKGRNFQQVKIEDSAKHVYLVLFTSGTTGVPKAVKIRDQAAVLQSDQLEWAYGKFLLTSPLFWISNALLLVACLLKGCSIVLPNQTDAETILKIIQRFKIESWFGGPSVLLDMCNLENVKDYDLSFVKQVYSGGSNILLEQKHMICNTLFKGRNILRMVYGSTEAGIVSQWPKSLDPDSPEFDSIGKPVVGMKLKIQDINSKETVGPGEKGEICVKSVCFMDGYMNEDLAKKELDEDGWWHMGDIGYYDKNGYLYYVSRIKDVFKYRGVQIAPSELESVLMNHPAVQEVCVVGKPHLIDGEWPAAFVVTKQNEEVTEKEVEEFVNACVPDSKKLRGGVHFLNSLPKNSVGKILPAKLLKLLE